MSESSGDHPSCALAGPWQDTCVKYTSSRSSDWLRKETGRFGNVPPLWHYSIEVPASVRRRQRETQIRMMALTRWFVRGILGVVLFVVACSALVAISLFAMYSDRHYVHST